MSPEMSPTVGHQLFSTQCFNEVWDLIERPQRTENDDQLMLSTCYASIYHWLHRDDCVDQNLSIGYWQLSRVYSLLQNGPEAKRAAELCLKFSASLEPFYQGYAYEAMARATGIAGNTVEAKRLAVVARDFAGKVEEAESRDMLLKDLDALS
ncbi:MAG: hypothetical protein R3C01_09275 [Planctomycetaceae bacterium]